MVAHRHRDHGPPVAPEAPTGLTARVVSGEAQVVLSWTAPANTGGAPITGYKIEASDDGNTSWTEVDTTAGDVTGYTDVGDDGNGPMFEVEEVRHYRVSAMNSVGEARHRTWPKPRIWLAGTTPTTTA